MPLRSSRGERKLAQWPANAKHGHSEEDQRQGALQETDMSPATVGLVRRDISVQIGESRSGPRRRSHRSCDWVSEASNESQHDGLRKILKEIAMRALGTIEAVGITLD